MKCNFIKDNIAIYIKLGAFSNIKIKQIKIDKEKLTYIILDR